MAALIFSARTLPVSSQLSKRLSFLHNLLCRERRGSVITLCTVVAPTHNRVVSKRLGCWKITDGGCRSICSSFVNLTKSSVGQAVNNEISSKNVLLIDEKGENQGLKSKEDALEIAREKSLQLVEVQKSTNGHSVCRLFSSKALINDQLKKKKQESKSRTHAAKLKELVIGGRIAPQDLNWKTKKVHDWLEERHQVKLCVKHKHWQNVTTEDKLSIIQQVVEGVKDVGELDGKPKQVGPLLTKCMFKPVHHK